MSEKGKQKKGVLLVNDMEYFVLSYVILTNQKVSVSVYSTVKVAKRSPNKWGGGGIGALGKIE